jgi:hypothetical protein
VFVTLEVCGEQTARPEVFVLSNTGPRAEIMGHFHIFVYDKPKTSKVNKISATNEHIISITAKQKHLED